MRAPRSESYLDDLSRLYGEDAEIVALIAEIRRLHSVQVTQLEQLQEANPPPEAGSDGD